MYLWVSTVEVQWSVQPLTYREMEPECHEILQRLHVLCRSGTVLFAFFSWYKLFLHIFTPVCHDNVLHMGLLKVTVLEGADCCTHFHCSIRNWFYFCGDGTFGEINSYINTKWGKVVSNVNIFTAVRPGGKSCCSREGSRWTASWEQPSSCGQIACCDIFSPVFLSVPCLLSKSTPPSPHPVPMLSAVAGSRNAWRWKVKVWMTQLTFHGNWSFSVSTLDFYKNITNDLSMTLTKSCSVLLNVIFPHCVLVITGWNRWLDILPSYLAPLRMSWDFLLLTNRIWFQHVNNIA